MKPIDSETWALFFDQAVEFLKLNVPVPQAITFREEEVFPRISFPIYYENKIVAPNDVAGDHIGGSLVFVDGEVKVELSVNPEHFFLPNGILRRGFELSTSVEPIIREMVSRHFLYSGRFL